MTESKLKLNTNAADISENDLRERYSKILDVLLRDHTTGKNIFWATDNYMSLGKGFEYHSKIVPALITGEYGKVIRPRVQKDKELQTARVRDMAEVVTPSWICNVQNNLIDNTWFGYAGAFNEEINTPDSRHTWEVNVEPVKFPDGKTWKDYVKASRLEITCGEAVGHTESFLSIGKFEAETEATACLKYIKSKFARTMLGALKVTQDNPRETWANVPMQDFTSSSDIDWSVSIPEIDQQLYKKYGLSADEINFIKTAIKPME